MLWIRTVKNAIRSILKDNGIVHLCVIQKFPSFIILGTDLTETLRNVTGSMYQKWYLNLKAQLCKFNYCKLELSINEPYLIKLVPWLSFVYNFHLIKLLFVVMLMCSTKWSSAINLDLFWKQVISYTRYSKLSCICMMGSILQSFLLS